MEGIAASLKPCLLEFADYFQSTLYADFSVDSLDVAVEGMAGPAKLMGDQLLSVRSFEGLTDLPFAIGESGERGSD